MKGFTLVELLVVIVVLGIVALITIPTISKVVLNSETQAKEKQISTIEKACEKWSIQNNTKLPTIDDEYICVELNILKEEEYLKPGEIIDPKTNEPLNGCIKVTYDSEYNQYQYEYIEN